MEELLATERLIVRDIYLTDIDDFYDYRSNPDVTKYQGFDVMTKKQCKSFIIAQQDKTFGQPGQWKQYAVVLKEANKLIGDCAIRLQQGDSRIAEIGITISHLYQKQGFAKEALTGVINWLFSAQQIHRIVETVDAANTASIRLLKSTGFRQEGHFIENIWFKGKWGSEYQFAMLKREWDETSKSVSG